MNPKLRPVEINPVSYEGEPFFLLKDPLQLSEESLLIPRPLALVLPFCDGTRDLDGIRSAVAIASGRLLRASEIEKLVSALDMACLLENERMDQVYHQELKRYRNAPSRVPALAGISYPEDPEALKTLFRNYLEGSSCFDEPLGDSYAGWRGIVSPHIDYERGGPVYASVWARAQSMVREAEIVVVLGTDHWGGDGEITLTRQNFSTPFGELPVSQKVIDDLAEELGEGPAFHGELRHRSEHSIELALNWLHFFRQEQPCDIVPILIGSFTHHLQAGISPEATGSVTRLLTALRRSLSGRRWLIVAAGDLSHVGPAFGGLPLDQDAQRALEESDRTIIQTLLGGDQESFFEAIRTINDDTNICGLAPIYLSLSLLGATEGECIQYDRCPADSDLSSFVSICGVLLK